MSRVRVCIVRMDFRFDTRYYCQLLHLRPEEGLLFTLGFEGGNFGVELRTDGVFRTGVNR